ncbi:chorismate mutase [Coralliovum pocilloporae]|uniref:chorismate mutase n=1 Tax=Coralliovum pocilloporae TaxID=3066369 RepID=UPI003307A9B9
MDHDRDEKNVSVLAPEDCLTKEDIRTQIDRLDVELISLFRQRLDYVTRMVDLKRSESLPGRIPWRVEEVALHVRQLAEEQGLDGALFERMWRELIDWNIAFEDGLLGDNHSEDEEKSR